MLADRLPDAGTPIATGPPGGIRQASDAVAAGTAGDRTRPISSAVAAAPTRAPAPLPAVFGSGDGIRLRLPSRDTVLIGFHEAATFRALPLDPHGRLRANRNRAKYRATHDHPGPGYVVLSSRQRPTRATTAVDLVLGPGTPVLSPVSGTVTEVRHYALYEKYGDHRIEIAPAANPGRRVVLIHIDHPTVAVGQQVTAGRTVLANGPRVFPFGSQIDGEVGRRLPHVHLEVKPAR